MKALYRSLILDLVLLINSQPVSAALVFNHPSPQAGAEFGSSMVFVGDINGDGIPDLLVGAPKQDIEGNGDQGQAYLLSGATQALLLTLNDPLPQAGAKFGAAVASAGDIDGDGKNDLLIGAPKQNVGSCEIGNNLGCSVGQAFVFSSMTGSLLLTLNHPTPASSSFFGSSVASIGDINGDLFPDLIVGSPGNGLGVFRPSQVFVFSGANGSLLFTVNDPHPVEAETEVGSTFGSVVAALADVNGDGKLDILVGDAQQDVGGVDQGQAHIFSGADGALILTIDHPDPQAGAFFSASAAGVADVDGDGIGDILVGAPRHDVGLNPDQGRAYVFSGATGELLRALDNPNPQFAANFGFAVAATGNFNGDAIPDFLVGAPGQTANGNPGQGQAFIFSVTNGSLLFTLDNPIPQRDSNFGRAVASGDDLDGDGTFDRLVAAPFQMVDGNSSQGQIGGFPFSTLGGGHQALIANAGPDQTVNESTIVNLNGTSSSDPNGDPLNFSWTQTAGPAVILSDPTSPTPTFTAPEVSASTVLILTFELVVNDGQVDSSRDAVNITVLGSACGVDLTGTMSKLTRKTSEGQYALNFTLNIFNAGTVESRGSFKVKFYISTDMTLGGSDTLVDTKSLKGTDSEGRIKPGNTVNVSASVKVGSPTQVKYLIAHIDSENNICESNETNNIVGGNIP